MSGFGQRFGDKGDVPHYFHDTHATKMIRKFYAKLVMHALCCCFVAVYGVYFMICGLLEDYLMKDGEITLCS